MTKYIRWNSMSQIVPVVLSLLGGSVYFIMALGHAHGQVSVIDEGLYLYKGILFAEGDYRPFQDFGPLTNHMPLSFLIPGWIQLMFGPGIRTGRYFAIFLGLFMLLGLWIATRRLAGRWWAAIALWAVALNPALLKIYSQATSQVLVASLLIWVLVFVVGNDRKTWQILIGVVLSGLLLMTRINMALVLILVLGYVFWNSGRRTGILATIIGLAVVFIGHAIYWPEVLKIWAKWIPEIISPFLNVYRLPSTVIPYWDPGISLGHRIGSLRTGFRLHLIPMIGFVGMSLTLPFRRTSGDLENNHKTAWLFVSLYGALLLFHGAASLGLNYCVYCFQNYLAFFSPVGLILVALLGKELTIVQNRIKGSVLLGIFVLLPFMFSPLQIRGVSESILATFVPRVSDFSVLPGTIQLHVLLGNKLGWDFERLRMSGIILLYLLLILVPIFTQLVAYLRERIKLVSNRSINLYPGITAFLVLEIIITTVVFGNSYREYDCGKDVIAANENVGSYLGQKIPENNQVFWGVGRSPVPMLYLPNRAIFPSQLNGDYSYMLQGESETLLKFGYWNQSLAKNWLMSADYVLFEVRNYSHVRSMGFNEDLYDEIERTPPTNPCKIESSIMIFKRE